MTLQLEGQLDLFDMLADLEPKPEPPNVADLTGWTFFETDPDKLDAIHRAWVDAYRGRNWDEWRRFPGWHEEMTCRSTTPGNQHPSFMYRADLSCHHSWRSTVSQRERGACQCTGTNGLVYRAYCSGCDWWTPVSGGENVATEAYLDHCWQGWRTLPVLESAAGKYKLPADYPMEWQIPGAPVRDCRGNTKYGTRHAPGLSPFGGYKTAVIRDCEKH